MNRYFLLLLLVSVCGFQSVASEKDQNEVVKEKAEDELKDSKKNLMEEAEEEEEEEEDDEEEEMNNMEAKDLSANLPFHPVNDVSSPLLQSSSSGVEDHPAVTENACDITRVTGQLNATVPTTELLLIVPRLASGVALGASPRNGVLTRAAFVQLIALPTMTVLKVDASASGSAVYPGRRL
ncbi:uncharacterized protein LOC135208272 [Macrobrachium nipponense]|uniref:uncharacterized protein LOC135208272 n=1 Tax=Macrobrachium nipponense TaxID=159736 RepID=UPI0030C8BA49